MLSNLIKIFIFTFAYFFVQTCFGQITFSNYYHAGLNNKSYANQIEVFDEDTTYLMYAPWQDQTSQQGLRLLKLNKNGNVAFDNKFMFGNNNFATYLNNRLAVKTSSYSSLAIGDTYYGNDRGLIFCKVNNKLADTIHTIKYCDYTYSYGLGNRFLKGGNQVWYIGNKFKENDNSFIGRPTIFKVDTNGNYLGQLEIVSLMNFGPTASCYDSILKQIYIGGSDYTIPQNPQNRIVCIDTLGNVIWNKLIVDIIGFKQIIKKNNYLVISGFKFTETILGIHQYKIVLLKLDCTNNGNIIWQKTYASQSIVAGLSAIVINNDESIVASGTFKYPSVMIGAINHDGVILKTNSNGDSLWMKTYGAYSLSTLETFYDIKKVPDGGYIMCGSPDYLNDCQSWVVKTDSLGIAPGISTNLKQNSTISSEGLMLSPNPANNILQLTFNSTFLWGANYQVKIFNSLGQLVLEEEIILDSEKAKINTESLMEGIYFLHFDKLYNQSMVKKFIIAR
ncbi:MAG: T9SS type A sorting domain-containing protein [Sphingobacteriaceae bacterium]|nr:T9SS type A sorting domain-containing protein [Sphingobacteriaceae bacterium]